MTLRELDLGDFFKNEKGEVCALVSWQNKNRKRASVVNYATQTVKIMPFDAEVSSIESPIKGKTAKVAA